MAVQIRLSSEQDVPLILPLVRAYHAFEHLESTASGREFAVRKLVGDRALGGIWLVFERQTPAGYIALCRGYSIEFGGCDAFVDEFYLEPAFRGKGIGAQVLELIKDEASVLEIRALHLEVARDNRSARRLYTRAGFAPREQYLLMSMAL